MIDQIIEIIDKLQATKGFKGTLIRSALDLLFFTLAVAFLGLISYILYKLITFSPYTIIIWVYFGLVIFRYFKESAE